MAVKGPFKMNLRYMGLSTDTKPTNIDVGAVFYETDSYVHYIWTGLAWVELV
jgi:hypothetical protein